MVLISSCDDGGQMISCYYCILYVLRGHGLTGMHLLYLSMDTENYMGLNTIHE